MNPKKRKKKIDRAKINLNSIVLSYITNELWGEIDLNGFLLS